MADHTPDQRPDSDPGGEEPTVPVPASAPDPATDRDDRSTPDTLPPSYDPAGLLPGLDPAASLPGVGPAVPGPLGGSFGAAVDVISTDDPAPARRGPDALTLIVGVLTLVASVCAFLGLTLDLTGFDPRWLLAAAAAAVGAWLLVSGLRQRRRAG